MTQKRESVREAEQRELAEEMAHEAGIIHRGTDLPREDVVELMIDFAKSTLLRIVNEAEQEADALMADGLSPYLDRAARARRLKSNAAWLREKAR